jgi:hypothetical protein
MHAARAPRARDSASTGIPPNEQQDSTMQQADTSAGTANQHLYAYTVREFDTADGKKARAWTRIGVAFPHKDGTGFNIEVHSFPLDGRIVLFPADADTRADEPTEAPPPPATNRSSHSRRR